MKPINLKIKGLNSFIDTQEINFEKLTSKGLFGIFGPTGSGKSTILDGITLALYGEVARKSTNFMNTNCDSLNVSYEFQISEKEVKRYRVDREFKRDKKSDSVRSKSAKIVNIIGDTEVILEDSVKTVTAKCEEIIGLKLEDFTRTVVLPQGNFSEFLKLEGKERRNMLERLFNLQKYGDNLSFKLGSKIKGEKEKANILEGELKAYEDCSDTIFEEKSKELSETKELYVQSQIELITAEDKFNKGKELWDLQIELAAQTTQEIELKKQEIQTKENQSKVTLGESALKVKPYIDGYEQTANQIKDRTKDLSILNDNIEIITENKENLEQILKEALNRKDNELSNLKIKEQQIIEAIDEKIKLDKLVDETKVLEENIINIKENLEKINSKIDQNETNIKNINTDIKDKEDNIDNLKIPEEYKKKINEAIVILSRYESLEKQKNDLSKNIKTTLSEIEKIKTNRATKVEELNEKKTQIESDNDLLTKLLDNCPGDQNTLIKEKEKLSNITDKWDKNREYSNYLQKSNDIINHIKSELVNKELEKTDLENKIAETSDCIKKIETEHMALTLRKELTEGEACPVCGSVDHHKVKVELSEFGDLEQLQMELVKKETRRKFLSDEIVTSQANIDLQRTHIEEYQEKVLNLGEEFKSISVENLQDEFNRLKEAIEQYNLAKSDLEGKIKKLTEEKADLDIYYNNSKTLINEKEEQVIKLDLNLKEIEVEYEKTKNELSSLKVELSTQDFKSKRDEILRMDMEKADIEMQLKTLRESFAKNQTQKEKLNKEIGELREEIKEKETSFIEKNKNIEDKNKNIHAKAGDCDNLAKLLEGISSSIRQIEENYTDAKKNYEEIEKKYQDCNDKIKSAQTNLASLNERYQSDKMILDNVLMEEKIESIEEAKNNLITKKEIDDLKIQIDKYKDTLTKLVGSMDSLKKKIDNRKLTAEQWNYLQSDKVTKTQSLKELEEKKIKSEENVKSLCKRLKSKKELLNKKEKLDYNLSLLDDLEKLFKGKKFVEFVAANQLKYVSIEASKKLKDITGGNYGLEVDENGKFLIRDYKNGGAKRDASTLSGGETFLTSLSLALALSAQIQLKGTAPLEFFFLDEGFGTLDDNLLEVVMDSLEKIHNDRLSIGLISHLDSIKNRVPVKLIVTAAEAGMGGSRVKIDRN